MGTPRVARRGVPDAVPRPRAGVRLRRHRRRPARRLPGGVRRRVGFPSEEDGTAAAIRKYRLFRMPGPRRFFVRAASTPRSSSCAGCPTAGELSDPRWPSHLHIDLMPAARGTGAAAGLMELWFDRLREVGSPGCYLQTSAENTRAVAFFERVGFAKYGDNPVVPGMRYAGERMHQQTMVWSVSPVGKDPPEAGVVNGL